MAHLPLIAFIWN